MTYGLIEDGVTTVADWTAAKTVTVKQCRDQVADRLHADRARRERLVHGHLAVGAAAARRCEAGHRRARPQLPGLRQAGSSRLPEGHPPARAGLRDADGDRPDRAADHRRGRPVQQVPRPAGRRAVVPQRRAQQRRRLRHRRLPLRDPVDRAHRRSQQLRRRLGRVGEEHGARHPRRFEADAAVQLRGDGEEPEGLRHRRLPRRAQQLRAVPRSGQLQLRDHGERQRDGELPVDDRCQRGHEEPDQRRRRSASRPWIKILGKGEIDYRGDPLVSSPITSACFGCHDSTDRHHALPGQRRHPAAVGIVDHRCDPGRSGHQHHRPFGPERQERGNLPALPRQRSGSPTPRSSTRCRACN